MPFIHSNKKYLLRSMNLIDPYKYAPPAPVYTMEAFVAPDNFSVAAQEMDIVQAFSAYPNVNKKYIYLVSPSVTSTTLDAVSGRSYAYSQNGGGYTVIASGTVTWIGGSTKRHIIVIDTASSVIAGIAIGGVWCYASDKVYSLYSNSNTYLKYLHLQNLSSLSVISANEFNSCISLTGKLIIPSSVTSIGDLAFYGCTGLTSVSIPNSVTSIGVAAFFSCTGATSITIPNSVTSLGDASFRRCRNAIFNNDNLVLSNLTVFSGSVFRECSKLKSLNLTSSSITSIGYFNFEGCTGLTSITIPNLVTSLGEGVFKDCTSLTSITIPNSVTSIGDSVFYNCTGLLSITIPNSVTSIGVAAFFSCTGATSITIPNSVTSLGDASFRRCRNAIFNNDNLVLSNLTVFSGSVFRECSKLKSLNLTGSSITSIGYFNFEGCTELTSITIPNSVTSLGEGVFKDCTSLTSITIPNSVTSIGDSVFYNCTGLLSITIPNSVPSIGIAAFFNCISLTFISIPSSVTSLGDAAFRNCTSLTLIRCYALNPPVLTGFNTFLYVPITALHVPTGRKSAYDAVAQWTDFEPIIEDL